MTDEKQAIDAAVEQFRSLMESQLARAKSCLLYTSPSPRDTR